MFNLPNELLTKVLTYLEISKEQFHQYHLKDNACFLKCRLVCKLWNQTILADRMFKFWSRTAHRYYLFSEKDLAKSVIQFLKREDLQRKEDESTFFLGTRLLRAGKCEEAETCFRKAALSGYGEAFLGLSQINKNYEFAKVYATYRAAKEPGALFPASILDWGSQFDVENDGGVITPCLQKRYYFYRLAAKTGGGEAQREFAMILKDEQKKQKWLERAAKNGDITAIQLTKKNIPNNLMEAG